MQQNTGVLNGEFEATYSILSPHQKDVGLICLYQNNSNQDLVADTGQEVELSLHSRGLSTHFLRRNWAQGLRNRTRALLRVMELTYRSLSTSPLVVNSRQHTGKPNWKSLSQD